MFVIGNLKDCVWKDLSWGKKLSIGIFRSSIKVFLPWIFVSKWGKNLSLNFNVIKSWWVQWV